MKALKKHHIIPLVAEEEGHNEDLIYSVVDYYWKEMITAIREMRHLNIEIHEIGEIRVAKSKLERYIETLTRYKNKSPEDSVQYKDMITKIERVQALIEMRDIEYQKRNEVRKKRKAYDEAKENMGK